MNKTAAFNPWHDISFGDHAPEVVQAVIEIPKGSQAKYELDKDSGFLRLDRVLYSAMHYPTNYGFIPKTYCDDKDPLDILVICSQTIVPMCLVDAKVIGVMHMQDDNETDDKIIAVAQHDMSVNYINDLSDLPPHTMAEIKGFFEDYKKLEHGDVVVDTMHGKTKACSIVNESIEFYQHTFGGQS